MGLPQRMGDLELTFQGSFVTATWPHKPRLYSPPEMPVPLLSTCPSSSKFSGGITSPGDLPWTPLPSPPKGGGLPLHTHSPLALFLTALIALCWHRLCHQTRHSAAARPWRLPRSGRRVPVKEEIARTLRRHCSALLQAHCTWPWGRKIILVPPPTRLHVQQGRGGVSMNYCSLKQKVIMTDNPLGRPRGKRGGFQLGAG